MNSRHPMIALLLGLAALALPGCKTSPLNDYFPLKVGREWRYLMNYEEETAEVSVMVAEKAADKYTLHETVVYGDYEIEFPFVTDEDNMFTVTDTAILVDFGQPFVLLKLPLEEGRTWATSATDSAVVLNKQPTSVPAGEFDDCFRIGYGADSENPDYIVWYAPAVGIVRIEVVDAEVWELTSVQD